MGGDDSRKPLPWTRAYYPPGRKPPAAYRITTLTHVHLLRCCFADGGFPWEETRAIVRHITRRENRGNLLVLNFWETSCVPCLKEMPSLSGFARKLRSEHVVVLAVGGDEDAQKYRRFLRDHRIALETYRDPDRRISKSFGTYMFPETYIIQDGRIIRKVVGAIDWMSADITTFVRAAAVKK